MGARRRDSEAAASGSRSGPPGEGSVWSRLGRRLDAGWEATRATPAWDPGAGEPAENKGGDSAKGAGTGSVKSSKKSKAARVGEDASKNGKEDSSRTMWRDMMTRLE